MKQNIAFITIILAALGLNPGYATAQNRLFKGEITTHPVRLQQEGDSLYVEVGFVLHDVKVKSAGGVEFIPQLVAPGKTLNLPKLSVLGKNEYLTYERNLALMTGSRKARYEEPYRVVKDHKRKNDTIPYRQTLPYEPWMAEARLDVRHDNCGCGLAALMEVEEDIDRVAVETPPLPYTVTPHLVYVQPVPEDVKRREIQAEAFLDFVVNKTVIRPDYMNNPRELRKIHNLIDELKNDQNISVNRLDIIGYASPEGTLGNNKRLSEGRAKALCDYLAAHYDFPRDRYHIVFGGENWDGLVAALDSIHIDHKDEIMNIIDTYTIEGGRESKLMNLRGGVPYHWMLKNIFPSLRVAICKVSYEIRNFNAEEAKEVIKERPQNLSLNEMYLVANTYPAGSEAFIEVFETAVRMYPDDEAANLNAATSALHRNDLVLAERYLTRVSPQTYPAEYNNTMGVLVVLKEEYETAERHLNIAAGAGLEAARLNLEEIEKKRDNK